MSDQLAAKKLVETQSIPQLLTAYKSASTWSMLGAGITAVASFLTINDLSGGWGANFNFSLESTEPYQYGFTVTAVAISAFIAFLQKDSSTASTSSKIAIATLLSASAINMASDVSNYAMRSEHQMKRVSTESTEYQQAQQFVNNIVNQSSQGISASPALTHALEKLSYHQSELAICKTKYEGKPKRIERCEEFEQNKVNLYQAKVTAQREAVTQAAHATTEQQRKLLEFGFNKVEEAGKNEDNYAPIIRLLSGGLAVSGFIANVLTSLAITIVILIGIFYAGQKRRHIALALRMHGLDVDGSKLHHPEASNDATIHTVSPTPSKQQQSFNTVSSHDFSPKNQPINTNAFAQPANDWSPSFSPNTPNAFAGNAALDTVSYSQPQPTADIINMQEKRVQTVKEENQIDLEELVRSGEMHSNDAANDSPTVATQPKKCGDTVLDTDTVDTAAETQTGAVNALINAHDRGELKKWSIRACTKVIRDAGIKGNDSMMRFLINEVAEPHFIEYGRAKHNPNWTKGGHNKVILLEPKSPKS